MGKSIVYAGLVGAGLLLLAGNVFTSIGQSVFPSSPMLGTAATGFAFGAGIQLSVRLLGVS